MTDENVRKIIVISGKGRPHEVMLLVVSVLLGIAFLLGIKPPNSIESLMPTWMRTAWFLFLLIGGSIGLVGIWWRNKYTGLVLERFSMILLSAAAGMYAVAVISYGKTAAIAVGAILIAWSIACGVRATQITSDLKSMRSD